MKVLYSTGKPSAPKATNTRNVPSAPEKILDAPDMLNDFYLHLMDWSSLNHMAVALSAGVYIWNAGDGSIVQVFNTICTQYNYARVSCFSYASVKLKRNMSALCLGSSKAML